MSATTRKTLVDLGFPLPYHTSVPAQVDFSSTAGLRDDDDDDAGAEIDGERGLASARHDGRR